jgi:hypothetical protein
MRIKILAQGGEIEMEGRDGGMREESRGRVKRNLYPARKVGSRGKQLDS